MVRQKLAAASLAAFADAAAFVVAGTGAVADSSPGAAGPPLPARRMPWRR
jgi:hypothetical protein